MRQLLVSIVVPLVAATTASATGMTPRQVAATQRVLEAVVSPDGTQVALIRSVPRIPFDDPDGPARTELWVVDASTGNEQPYVTGAVEASAVSWSADGSWVWFLVEREGDDHDVLERIRLAGGEAERVVAMDEPIAAYDVAPAGDRVVVISRVPRTDADDELRDAGFDQVVYEEDWRHRAVWTVALEGGDRTPERLELEGSAYEARFAPDGRRLAVRLAPTPLVDDRYMRQRIEVVSATSGERLATVDHRAKLGSVRWSPDGRRLGFIAGVDLHDPAESSLFVVAADGGVPTNLTEGWEAEATDFAWTPDGDLAMLVSEGVTADVVTLDPGGEIRRRHGWSTGPAVATELTLAGSILGLVAESPDHPPEAFVATLGDDTPRRLTDSNPWLAEVELGRQEVVRWTARDGLELEGLLIHPLDRAEGERVPLAVVVHGGPEAHRRNGWLSRYSAPVHVLAARGIASFVPNYRGSTGRGVEFSKAGQGDPAGAEFDDIVDGVDALVDRGLVDSARVGVTGGSYGGYATAWLSTRYSDRFAAGVMFVGISNKISKTGTTDIPEEEFLVHARMRPWDDWQKYLERSPIYWAGQGRTPLLILHGEKDPRVSVTQSHEMYRALKTRGTTPVRLVLYPDEKHGNRKAAARFDYMLRMLRWMEHYLLGEGGAPPPIAVDYRDRAHGWSADDGGER